MLSEQPKVSLEQLKKDYLHIFSGEEGKRVLEDLEKKCFMSHTTAAETPERMILNEGMRCVYLHIKMMMNFDMDKLKELTDAV
jgi:hypothetical protein